jgi:predicted cupin superfamily sugar epimerase
MNTETLIRTLNLKPHPEGGFYAETYRSAEGIAAAGLPPRYGGARAFSTAIYYLLTADSFSALHRLKSDEVFHFYLGDPVEMLVLPAAGGGCVLNVGAELGRGEQPQAVIPAGAWQGARLRPGGVHALLGCTVAPGFDFADFEAGGRRELRDRYPAYGELIAALTHSGV